MLMTKPERFIRALDSDDSLLPVEPRENAINAILTSGKSDAKEWAEAVQNGSKAAILLDLGEKPIKPGDFRVLRLTYSSSENPKGRASWWGLLFSIPAYGVDVPANPSYSDYAIVVAPQGFELRHHHDVGCARSKDECGTGVAQFVAPKGGSREIRTTYEVHPERAEEWLFSMSWVLLVVASALALLAALGWLDGASRLVHFWLGNPTH